MFSILLASVVVGSQTTDASVTWTRIPLRTEAVKRAGFIGGEGAQWPRGLTTSADGSVFYLAIDVGGILRSLDQGKTWQPSNVGYTPRGSACIAVDPNNSSRAFSVGANSVAHPENGLYLTTDKGSSWKPVFKVPISGLDEHREQFAFDPTTFDAASGATQVVYWSRIRKEKPGWGTAENKPLVYKTIDGGKSWAELPGSEIAGGAILRHHPKRGGLLLAANELGLHLTTNGGTSWRTVVNQRITGLDVDTKTPGRFIYTMPNGVFAYTVGAAQPIVKISDGPSQTGHILKDIKVHPKNPLRMVLWRDQDPNSWDWRRYASQDGGKTWTQSSLSTENMFLPCNARQGVFAWNPTKESEVWCIGGDTITKSTDGGKNYVWAGDGYNGLLIGGSFNFSAQNPDIVGFGSQDYNAAITRNGGDTWTYLNPTGNGWGGFCYGGYAADDKLMWVGNSDSWGGKRTMRISQDGGSTWTDTGIELKGLNVSSQHPGKPNILFAYNMRSTDRGKTWKPMPGCSGVLTANPKLNLLLGVLEADKKWSVVQSADDGQTWKVVATQDEEIHDLAYNPTTNEVFVACTSLKRLNLSGVPKLKEVETPVDQLGNRRVKTVAIDPVDPNVVYIGNNANIYSVDNAVCRSTDNGKTWQVLTRRTPLKSGELDGGRETFWIRVHPKTREAWCATSCYGQWKVGPPKAR